MSNKNLRSRLILILANLYRRMIIFLQYFHSLRVRFKKEKQEPMIFCIGFSKTGTTSLDKALSILGRRPIHWPRAHIKPKKGWMHYFRESPYDSFSDAPVYFPEFYKELDKEFPNSKFILTVREPKSLMKSWENYFKNAPWSIETKDKKQDLLKVYNDHNKDVLKYFKDNPSQLLVFDLFGGDEWEKLCNFLDKPIPEVPFPHKRKANYKKK